MLLFDLMSSAAAFLSPHRCSESCPSPPLPYPPFKGSSLKICLKLKKNFCLFSFDFFSAWPFLAGGGGVFILWKLEEAKQFHLLWWVGVYL